MKNYDVKFKLCERCGKIITQYNEMTTCDIQGNPVRSVCPDCYKTVMKYGYDNEICSYEDEEFSEQRRCDTY